MSNKCLVVSHKFSSFEGKIPKDEVLVLGNLRTSLEIVISYSEVVKIGYKSHAFDPKKVGMYTKQPDKMLD